MQPSEIATLIESGLPGCQAQVLSDDNTHFQAVVISDAFEGKRALARHQLVYQCLGERMGREIHALSIQAHTGAEWAQRNSSD